MIGFVQVELVPSDSPEILLADIKQALSHSATSDIRKAFARADDGTYLWSMAANRGGLSHLKISVIPSPPGWSGKYWAIFHTVQTIEQDHDPVYELLQDPQKQWKLGPEIPEDDLNGWQIKSARYKASLSPLLSKVDVEVALSLTRGGTVAVPFRLNENYHVSGVRFRDNGKWRSGKEAEVLEATDTAIPRPKEGDLVRAGSLMIPWTTRLGTQVQFDYSSVLPKGDEDEVTPMDAYLTAWWLPSLGRLPFTVESTIVGPSNWRMRAEGTETSFRINGGEQTTSYSCPLPISYPKIVAGKYKEMASTTVDGDRFAIYQLEPADAARARRDLKETVEAARFFRSCFGPLPFHGYECYDADRFYGIESYSHTLLQRGVTHFISHEMGHSYFGGFAPCAYVHDSWNEGVTQYVDSVVFNKDSDRSLEYAERTLDVPLPLSQMAVPYAFNGASYWRGCYVMKMLEGEIGLDKVLTALRRISTDRVGKNTRWDDLRPYFEHEATRSLKWFWDQWIDGAVFPTLHYTSDSIMQRDGSWNTTITIRQEKISQPFRIRIAIRLAGEKSQPDVPVRLADWTQTFQMHTVTKPSHVELVTFPFTLVHLRRTAGTG